jgi:hypothetical protein
MTTPSFGPKNKSKKKPTYSKWNFSPGRCRWHIPLKFWMTFNGLHSVISQKRECLIATTMRTSNPTYNFGVCQELRMKYTYHWMGHSTTQGLFLCLLSPTQFHYYLFYYTFHHVISPPCPWSPQWQFYCGYQSFHNMTNFPCSEVMVFWVLIPGSLIGGYQRSRAVISTNKNVTIQKTIIWIQTAMETSNLMKFLVMFIKILSHVLVSCFRPFCLFF